MSGLNEIEQLLEDLAFEKETVDNRARVAVEGYIEYAGNPATAPRPVLAGKVANIVDALRALYDWQQRMYQAVSSYISDIPEDESLAYHECHKHNVGLRRAGKGLLLIAKELYDGGYTRSGKQVTFDLEILENAIRGWETEVAKYPLNDVEFDE